jgi:hypothetical protein
MIFAHPTPSAPKFLSKFYAVATSFVKLRHFRALFPRLTRAEWLDDPVRTTSRTDCASLDLGQELLVLSNRSNTAGKVVRVSGTAANMPMIMAKPRNSRE